MALCGTVQQTKRTLFRVFDNREREDVEVSAILHVGQQSHVLPVEQLISEKFAYEFYVTGEQLGVAILVRTKTSLWGCNLCKAPLLTTDSLAFSGSLR